VIPHDYMSWALSHADGGVRCAARHVDGICKIVTCRPIEAGRVLVSWVNPPGIRIASSLSSRVLAGDDWEFATDSTAMAIWSRMTRSRGLTPHGSKRTHRLQRDTTTNHPAAVWTPSRSAMPSRIALRRRMSCEIGTVPGRKSASQIDVRHRPTSASRGDAFELSRRASHDRR
jgi:hypothetical protein